LAQIAGRRCSPKGFNEKAGTKMINIRATISKYHELSWKTLTKLKSWMRCSAPSFDVENLASPSTRIAVATDDGEIVAITPIETVYMISGYTVAPTATPEQKQQAGDLIEYQCRCLAQQAGVTRILMVLSENVPLQPDEKWLRVIYRQVPQSVITGGAMREQCTPSQVTYVN
jgi:flagellar biosynthesis component FlhA